MKTCTSPHLPGVRRPPAAPWLAALAALTCAGLVACSGAPVQPKDETDPSPGWEDSTSGLDDGSHADDEPGAEAEAREEDDRPPPRKTEPEPEDYDMTHRDCEALAQTYENAWLHDELPKLADKKLNAKQHQAAEADLREAATAAGEQWYGQCEGIVGTAFLRSRLVCAMKAKSLQRFNDCWDGKVE